MNHIQVTEGCEVAIEILVEKMSICEVYAGIYDEVQLRSTVNTLQLRSMLDSALPNLYGAVIVFAIKARTYFEARGMYMTYGVHRNHTESKLGMKRLANILMPFDVEFKPFIEEINAKERVIHERAGATFMERIKSMVLHMVLDIIAQSLTQGYRHGGTFTQIKWLVENIS